MLIVWFLVMLIRGTESNANLMNILHRRQSAPDANDEILAIFNNQIDTAINELTTLRSSLWIQATSTFATANENQQKSIQPLATVFNTTNTTLEATVASPHCAVADFANYVLNSTASLEYMCCHVSRMTLPGLPELTARIVDNYLGVARPTNVMSGNMMLHNMQKIVKNELIGLRGRACMDDVRLIDLQTSIVRAMSTTFLVTQFVHFYQNMQLDVEAVTGCLDNPLQSTNCNSNNPMSYNSTLLNQQLFSYVKFNPLYNKLCSKEALQAFELNRFFIPCSLNIE